MRIIAILLVLRRGLLFRVDGRDMAPPLGGGTAGGLFIWSAAESR